MPGRALSQQIAERVRKGPVHGIDAHAYALRLFGDSIASNMFLLGMAYQFGYVPIHADAIEQAIELNGAAVEMNKQAFRFGRLAAHDRAALDRIARPARVETAATAPAPGLEALVARRAEHLAAYQDEALAQRYRAMVASIAGLEHNKAPGRAGLAEAVARGYHKLLAIKDEYEVARLYTDGRFEKMVAEQFDGVTAVTYHMAPPFLAWLLQGQADWASAQGAARRVDAAGAACPVVGARRARDAA